MARIVVAGAGVVGLFTSLVLARDGHEVTVLDRDGIRPPETLDEKWISQQWPGVKQYDQTHVLMPGGAQILAGELPEAASYVRAAGGRAHDMLEGAWRTGRFGSPRAEDAQFGTLAARRPVLEGALLRLAAETPGLTVRSASRVRSLILDAPGNGPARVTGVVTESGETQTADLVVDAGGRRTEIPDLLAEQGVAPRITREHVGFRYYSRFFRADGRGLPDNRMWPLTHHNSISVITAPGDGDHWSVTLVTSGRDQALRDLADPQVWDRVLALYPDAAPWAAGAPQGGVRVMGGTGAVHRRWHADGAPLVTGMRPVGDAYMTTNPQFGMGMTAGFGQALQLRETLRAVGPARATELVTDLDARLEEHFWPMWSDGVTWDRHRLAEIQADGQGRVYETDDPAWHLRSALDLAAFADAEILRGYGQVASMLATAQDALIKTGLLERIVELGAGRPRYSGVPGPDRATLVRAIEGLPGV